MKIKLVRINNRLNVAEEKLVNVKIKLPIQTGTIQNET